MARIFLAFVVLLSTFLFAQARWNATNNLLDETSDRDLVNLALYHSQNAYCDPATYTTRTYKGVLEGFVPTHALYDKDHDTNGYIGYTSSQSRIYVSYRGSESIQNWIDNLDAVLTDYPLCGGCEVHKGFYKAETSIFNEVLTEVKSLKAQFPSYNVVVTGHSLGAAMATLTAMDLKNAGVTNVKMINFGSPRVGNTDFANWYSSNMESRARVTHHKDMVPHSPMHERFTHISGEWYEPDDSTNPVYVNSCSGNEDSSCSYQWHITSISDHLWYLSLPLGTSDGACDAFL